MTTLASCWLGGSGQHELLNKTAWPLPTGPLPTVSTLPLCASPQSVSCCSWAQSLGKRRGKAVREVIRGEQNYYKTTIARRFQFFGSGSLLGSCFRVKTFPRFFHRFLEPVLEPSSVRFSVFYEESRIFLGIPDFCRYSWIFLNFLGLFGWFF